MARPKICVVGACNIDLISYVPRLPALGETLHGSRFTMGYGGKGANQAVMAAKLGGEVGMISKLGQDTFGDDTLGNFKKSGVDTRHVHFTDQAFSGVAPIAVDSDGNNSIIIVTGANDLLTVDEIEAARQAIAQAQIMVCQLEVPLQISLAALRIAREERVTTIFNPAPAKSELPQEIYRLSDIFCPNETETEILTGMSVESIQQATDAARVLIDRGAGKVILTLGERGSLLVTKNRAEHIPVEPVKAVDTTGAGDSFVGSLAYFIALGKPLEHAIRLANTIAAISVQAHGTQTSFPDAKDLPGQVLDQMPQPNRPTRTEAKSPAELAACIDHTLLKPDATQADFDILCGQAISYGFKTVCVNSNRIAYVAKKLEGSKVAVCSVIGFPLGTMDTQAKAFEAGRAIEQGAAELDMVIDIGALKSGDYTAVENDIKAVRETAAGPSILKVIIETCLLTDDEKVKACEIAKSAGADYVKTSTGFAGAGATIEDVALMKKAAGDRMRVKASGGIKDATTAMAMIEAGADRIGAGAGVHIVESLKGRV